MPENIKQLVIGAFADHDPLLLSALAISENFIREVVLGIINDMHTF